MSDILKTLPVAWFNDAKGYGFLKDGEVDVFVHYTAILDDGFKTLVAGQQVDCIVIDKGKGPQATAVVKRLDLPMIDALCVEEEASDE
jgi:CspA family cold shock protein